MRFADIFHIMSMFSANYLFWCILVIVWSSNIYSHGSIPTALAEQLEKASERSRAESMYIYIY